MGRGAQPGQEAGGPEDQGAGAHRRGPARVAVDLAQPVEQRLVLHGRPDARPAGDDDDIGPRDLVQAVLGEEGEGAGVALEAGLARHEADTRAGQRPQHLVGADGVEGGDAVEGDDGYVDGRILCRPCRSDSTVCPGARSSTTEPGWSVSPPAPVVRLLPRRRPSPPRPRPASTRRSGGTGCCARRTCCRG